MSSEVNNRMNTMIRKARSVGRMTLDTAPEQSEESKKVNKFVRTEVAKSRGTMSADELVEESAQDQKGDK